MTTPDPTLSPHATPDDTCPWPPDEMANLMDAIARSADRMTNSSSETAHLSRNAARCIRSLSADNATLRAEVERLTQSRDAHSAQMYINAELVTRTEEERDAALARCAELEAALRPFAERCGVIDATDHIRIQPDAARLASSGPFTLGDFRRARAALSTQQAAVSAGENE